MKYVYPAIFAAEGNNTYSVYFPDLEGCYTCGDNLEDALYMAEDVLGRHILLNRHMRIFLHFVQPEWKAVIHAHS